MKWMKWENAGWNVYKQLTADVYISYNAHPGFFNEDPEETALAIWQGIPTMYIKQWDLRSELDECNTIEEVFNVFLLSNLPDWHTSSMDNTMLLNYLANKTEA